MIHRIACVLGLALLTLPTAATAQKYSEQLLSVAYVTEEDEAGEDLTGIKLGYVLYGDDHSPPLTGALTFEALEGDGSLLRTGLSLSILELPGGKPYSLWVRPVAGFQYRGGLDSSEVDTGAALYAALGAEFIVRPHRRVQLALTHDWIFTTGGESTRQIGLAFRWGT